MGLTEGDMKILFFGGIAALVALTTLSRVGSQAGQNLSDQIFRPSQLKIVTENVKGSYFSEPEEFVVLDGQRCYLSVNGTDAPEYFKTLTREETKDFGIAVFPNGARCYYFDQGMK